MKPTQALNDGVVKIYSVGNTAAAGDMPTDGLSLKCSLRFKRRTIGVQRLYSAKQVNARVDLLLRCNYLRQVSPQDVALVENIQYEVTDIQYIEDSAPPMMDLTLKRLEADYDLTGI